MSIYGAGVKTAQVLFLVVGCPSVGFFFMEDDEQMGGTILVPRGGLIPQ